VDESRELPSVYHRYAAANPDNPRIQNRPRAPRYDAFQWMCVPFLLFLKDVSNQLRPINWEAPLIVPKGKKKITEQKNATS